MLIAKCLFSQWPVVLNVLASSLPLCGLFAPLASASGLFPCQSVATVFARHSADRLKAADGDRRFTLTALQGCVNELTAKHRTTEYAASDREPG